MATNPRICVYLVPVFEGRLVVFDVSAREARGRWLPWDILPDRGNPYEVAATLGDNWCASAISALTLADILSLTLPHPWELAIIFRAELTALPLPDPVRTPFLYPTATFDAIGAFDPVDLERWVAAPRPEGRSSNLLF